MRFIKVLIYYLAGICLLIYIGLSLYQNLSTVTTDSALVTTNVHVLEAQMNGSIQSVSANTNDSITEGAPIIRIGSPDLEVKLVQARHDLQEAILNRNRVKSENSNQKEQLNLYSEHLDRKQTSLNDMMKKTQQNVASCEDYYVKCYSLWRRGIINSNEMLQCTATLHNQRRDLAELKLEEDSINKAISSAQKGYIYTDANVDWGAMDAKSNLDVAEGMVVAKQEKLKSLESLGGRLTVSAPADGRLKIMVKNGHYVKAGDPVAVVEETGNLRIEAFIDRSKLGKISLDSEATVVSGLSKGLSCKVANIDFTPDVNTIRNTWTMGTLSDVKEGYVSVQLEFENDDAKELVAGYPVTVRFERKSFKPLKKIIGDIAKR